MYVLYSTNKSMKQLPAVIFKNESIELFKECCLLDLKFLLISWTEILMQESVACPWIRKGRGGGPKNQKDFYLFFVF